MTVALISDEEIEFACSVLSCNSLTSKCRATHTTMTSFSLCKFSLHTHNMNSCLHTHRKDPKDTSDLSVKEQQSHAKGEGFVHPG